MLFLFSSAGDEVYRQFILQVLCYPKRYVRLDVPYGLGRVQQKFRDQPQLLEGKTALIVFVTYVGRGKLPEPVYFPLRECVIIKAKLFAGKVLLDLDLGEFVYYEDWVRRAYEEDVPLDPRKKWNSVIKASGGPTASPKAPYTQMDFSNPESWGSKGDFVMEVDESVIDVTVDPQKAEGVRERSDDWISVIDVISKQNLLAGKLFYQICQLRDAKRSEVIPHTLVNGRTVFELRSGVSVDVIVHVYPGKGRRLISKKELNVTVDPELVSVAGGKSIEVYPEQSSGKLERIQLVVKRRLSREETLVSLQEGNGGEPALAKTEMRLVIRPNWVLIASILLLFAVGTVLNGWSVEGKWLWLFKAVGSLLMTGSFFLAFYEFPKKA